MLGLNQISLAVNRLLGPGEPAAALDLNFLSGSLDSRITFTRASTATRYNSSGLIETVSSGSPRFDYDPVTLAPKGLLIEESRTNQHRNSSRLSGWSMFQGSTTLDAATSPDGTTNSASVLESTAFGFHSFYSESNLAGTSGTPYTFTIYAKANGRTRCQINCQSVMLSTVPVAFYDLSALTVDNVAAGATATVYDVGNGWRRLQYTFTADSSFAAGTMYINQVSSGTTVSYAGDTSKGMFFYGAQLEAGSFPTSYIPTTTAAVTRAADAVSMTGTNFSSWYNQTEGTFVVEASTLSLADLRGLYRARNNTGNTYIQAFYNTTGAVFSNTVVTSEQNNAEIAGVTVNSSVKNAYAYKASNFAASVNGGAVTSGSAGSVPSDLSQIFLGSLSGGSYILNGHIKQLRYYNTRKSNAELQTLTT